MLGLEYPEWQRSGQQGQCRAAGPKAAIYIHIGSTKIKAVARRTTHQWNPAEDILKCASHRFFTHGQSINEQECETILVVCLWCFALKLL